MEKISSGLVLAAAGATLLSAPGAYAQSTGEWTDVGAATAKPVAPSAAAKAPKPPRVASITGHRGLSKRAPVSPHEPDSFAILPPKARSYPIPGEAPGFILDRAEHRELALQVEGPAAFKVSFYAWNTEDPADPAQVDVVKFLYSIDGIEFPASYSMSDKNKIVAREEVGGKLMVLTTAFNFPVQVPAGSHRLVFSFGGSHDGVVRIEGLKRSSVARDVSPAAEALWEVLFEDDPRRPAEFTRGVRIQDNPAGARNPFTAQWVTDPTLPVSDLSEPEVEEVRDGRSGLVKVMVHSTFGECIGRPYTYEGIARVGQESVVRFTRVWPPAKSAPGARGPAEFPLDLAWGIDDATVRILVRETNAAEAAADAADADVQAAWHAVEGANDGLQLAQERTYPDEKAKQAALAAAQKVVDEKTADAVRAQADTVRLRAAALAAALKASDASRQKLVVSHEFPDGPSVPSFSTSAVCLVPGYSNPRANVFLVSDALDRPRTVHAASLPINPETVTNPDCVNELRKATKEGTYTAAFRCTSAGGGTAPQLRRWQVTMRRRQ